MNPYYYLFYKLNHFSAGFSIHNHTAFGRYNLILSIGDPLVIGNETTGFWCGNPTAGSYASGVTATPNAQGGGGLNAFNYFSTQIDAFSVASLKLLTNEYKVGADVIEIAKSVKAVTRLGKMSSALNAGSVAYDVASGNVHTSTFTDAAMIGVGVVVGIAVGPITAGVVGIIYGGAMILGGQDAINKALDGNWNIQINKSIRNLYKK